MTSENPKALTSIIIAGIGYGIYIDGEVLCLCDRGVANVTPRCINNLISLPL